ADRLGPAARRGAVRRDGDRDVAPPRAPARRLRRADPLDERPRLRGVPRRGGDRVRRGVPRRAAARRRGRPERAPREEPRPAASARGGDGAMSERVRLVARLGAVAWVLTALALWTAWPRAPKPLPDTLWIAIDGREAIVSEEPGGAPSEEFV